MIELRWVEEASRELPEGGDAINVVFELLQLDIVESDSYEVSSLVTEHSVESREQITDHQVPQLDKVSVNVVISESPSSRTIGEGTTYAEVRLTSGATASVVTTPAGVTRTDDALHTLRRLCREGIDVDVDGLRRPLEGWMITSISSPRDVASAGALSCTVSLVEVSVASSATVDAPSPRVERGRRSQNRGRAVCAPVQAMESTSETQTVMNEYYDPETGAAW